ncbi:hypothetical protein DFH06DRAFT_1141324 [Mycena polygramma]|nr:hypothetical protein DFH06DRAFT_1141324 [Mycena polygramma]
MATRAQLHRTMATRTQSHRRKNYIYLCGNYHPRVDPRVDPEVDPKVYPEVYPEVYRRVPPEKPRKGQTNMYMHYAPNGGTKEFDSRAVETTVVYTLSSGCQSPNGARAEDGEAPRRAEANILAVADAARAGEVEPAPPALEDAEVQQPFCNVKSSIATTPDAITPQPNNNPPTARAFGVLPLAAAHAVGVARLQPDPPREFGVRDEQRAPEQYIHLPDVCVEVDVASPFALVRVHGLCGEKAENLSSKQKSANEAQLWSWKAGRTRPGSGARSSAGGDKAAVLQLGLSPSESAVEPVKPAPMVTQEEYKGERWVPEGVSRPWGGKRSQRGEEDGVQIMVIEDIEGGTEDGRRQSITPQPQSAYPSPPDNGSTCARPKNARDRFADTPAIPAWSKAADFPGSAAEGAVGSFGAVGRRRRRAPVLETPQRTKSRENWWAGRPAWTAVILSGSWKWPGEGVGGEGHDARGCTVIQTSAGTRGAQKKRASRLPERMSEAGVR